MNNSIKNSKIRVALLGAILVLALAMAAGCGNKVDVGDSGIVADKAFLETYIAAPQGVLGDRFSFSEAKDLDSRTLYDFFVLMTKLEGNAALLPDVGEDGLYHIPTAVIIEILDRYLAGYSFEPADIDGYNMAEDTIDLASIPESIITLPEYKVIESKGEGGQLTLTVDFYKAGSKDEVEVTRQYVFQKTDEAIRYVKVEYMLK